MYVCTHVQVYVCMNVLVLHACEVETAELFFQAASCQPWPELMLQPYCSSFYTLKPTTLHLFCIHYKHALQAWTVHHYSYQGLKATTMEAQRSCGWDAPLLAEAVPAGLGGGCKCVQQGSGSSLTI